MNTQWFLGCLMVVSVMTGLVTEALKKILTEWNITYQSNTLAGVVAAVLAVLTGGAYCVLMEVEVSPQLVVMLVALILLAWLCAMVGYDKVIQAIGQFRGGDDSGPDSDN